MLYPLSYEGEGRGPGPGPMADGRWPMADGKGGTPCAEGAALAPIRAPDGVARPRPARATPACLVNEPTRVPIRSTATDLTCSACAFESRGRPVDRAVRRTWNGCTRRCSTSPARQSARRDPVGPRSVGTVVAHDHRWPPLVRLGTVDGIQIDPTDLPAAHQPRPSAIAPSQRSASSAGAHAARRCPRCPHRAPTHGEAGRPSVAWQTGNPVPGSGRRRRGTRRPHRAGSRLTSYRKATRSTTRFLPASPGVRREGADEPRLEIEAPQVDVFDRVAERSIPPIATPGTRIDGPGSETTGTCTCGCRRPGSGNSGCRGVCTDGCRDTSENTRLPCT